MLYQIRPDLANDFIEEEPRKLSAPVYCTSKPRSFRVTAIALTEEKDSRRFVYHIITIRHRKLVNFSTALPSVLQLICETAFMDWNGNELPLVYDAWIENNIKDTGFHPIHKDIRFPHGLGGHKQPG